MMKADGGSPTDRKVANIEIFSVNPQFGEIV